MPKIQRAIKACVAECFEFETPFLCISQFCIKLTEDPYWTAEEIDEVATQAWRTLFHILQKRGEIEE